MLLASPINADRGDQDQLVADVQAIDLDRQQIKRRQIGGQPFPHLRARQSDELARHRRLRGAVARDRPDIAARQAHRAAELPGRDVDQHLVHRPLAEPVLVLRRGPTRQHQFLLALTAANPGAINPDPASVKADLALGLTPPPAPPPVMPLMAVAADHGRFFLQKLLKRLDPSDQAELVKAALNFLESHGHGRPFVRHRGCIQGYRGSRCAHIFLHGVAPLRGWNTPSLPAQGEQRPPPICNIDRDIPVMDIARGQLQGDDLIVGVEDEVQLEAEEPAHRGLAALGQTGKDLMPVKAMGVADRQGGGVDVIDPGPGRRRRRR